MKSKQLESAVETLVTCRDLCGNERECLREWEQENGTLSENEWRDVLFHFENAWHSWRVKAGVSKPISASERRVINRILA